MGKEMYALISELYPICRSITGDGFRQTMEILQRFIPLKIHEVPSGTRVYDWVVPKEWNIRDAYIKNSAGEKIVDFQNLNLHVLNYSIPIKKVVSLTELKEHLFTLPEHPDWIPYRTSYYKDNWGFCLTHRQFSGLEEGEYEVFIDSTLDDGSLTYGELYLQGEEENEILLSTHACHPSLANDNLSGISLSTILAKCMDKVSRRYSYRFLFMPGTIGAITWLNLNEAAVNKIRHGLVITGVGDPGKITYKKSRRGDAEIDRAVIHVINQSGQSELVDFCPYGYDERQYCSPGFNLPVGRLSRTVYGQYPEYHTSADNLEFVHPEFLGDSFSKVLEVLHVLENNRTYINLNSKCEPQFEHRGLYCSNEADRLAMLWVLNLSDGNNTLLDIAETSGLRFDLIFRAGNVLFEHDLLKRI